MVIHIQRLATYTEWPQTELAEAYALIPPLTLAGLKKLHVVIQLSRGKGRYLLSDEAIAGAEPTRAFSSYQFNPVWLFTLVGKIPGLGTRKYNDQLVAYTCN
jgi:hypothetical protein